MHLPNLIFDLAIILAIAGMITLVCHRFRQPVVLGYLLSGLIIGPYTPPFQFIKDIEGIKTWAELGVIFLMFCLGLEFSFRKLISVGFSAIFTAIIEVLFFLFVGYFLGVYFFHWSKMDSMFLGAMLSMSSTTIIIKALEELKLKSRKFATLIFGVLIVEDLLAIFLIVGLTSIASSGDFSLVTFSSAALKLLLVVSSWIIAGYFIVPRLMSYVGKTESNEMLTLVSIGLCLSLVVLAANFEYSSALGAFIMGSIIAESRIIQRIEHLMIPLRDLFGAIFFVSVGMLIDPQIIWEYRGTVLALCIVTVIGKIFISSLGPFIAGESFKNSLQVGFGLAQIGEFSFIIASLGLALNATSSKLYPIAVSVSVVTTFLTPYLVKASGPLADKFEKKLPLKVRYLIEKYITWCEYMKKKTQNSKEFLSFFSRWVLNGIITTLLFTLSLHYIPPFLEKYFPLFSLWKNHSAAFIAFALSSPFLWKMFFIPEKSIQKIRDEKSIFQTLGILLFPALTGFLLVLLTTRYFPLMYIIFIISVFLFLAYFSLHKRLELSYRWLEETFLASFENGSEKKSILKNLAPWDSHLVQILVHPNAMAVNKTLAEINLRQRFGINVVVIQRGIRNIIAPLPTEMILPHDLLVILGTDEQIDHIKIELTIPSPTVITSEFENNYCLKYLIIPFEPTLSGKSIRELKIRETYSALVVGLERKMKRKINPDIDTKLEGGDIVWIVGEEKMLDTLIKDFSFT